MKNLWLVPLEKIPTRYTQEWYYHVPNMLLEKSIAKNINVDLVEFEDYDLNSEKITIVNIAGELPSQKASKGAFINFASTNIWKASQAQKIAIAFNNNWVKPGDKFYFTDSWNTTILQVRYMSDLMAIPVEIHSQWHAGNHDPSDALAQRIVNKDWIENTEAALFFAIDKNYFTTDFYWAMFYRNVLGSSVRKEVEKKIVRCGYPNSYLIDKLDQYQHTEKERIVLFPHRICAEKQTDIFKDLEKEFKDLPDYKDVKFIVCQEQNLNKQEYHELLGRSMVVFSAALQETYGIAQTEAIFAGSYPLSPNRLSYAEMYTDHYRYPSEWTENFDTYTNNKNNLIKLICSTIDTMENPSLRLESKANLEYQKQYLINNYIGDNDIFKQLFKVCYE